MTGLLRTTGRVLAVSALTVGTLPLGSSVRAEDVRTDTKLGGFAISVEATPLRVLVDDPALAIPHDPGTAVVEADPNYTLATVSAGPNALAVTSTFWPGNLLGTGFQQLGSPVAYPLAGSARYPDKPYDATGKDGGALSSAHAEGLEALATADGTPTNKPGQVTVGGVLSRSSASVTAKDVATGSATSAITDISLLGLIKIGSVKTVLTTTADGKATASSGTTTVAGLSIAGNEFTVDGTGLHAAGQGTALPVLDTPAEVSKTLGITARALNQTVTRTGSGVKRAAGGLVIKVDTAPLRALLAPANGVLNPVINTLIGSLPPQVASNLYYLVKATPNITFVIASANSSSSANLPLTLPPFQFPSFPSAPGGFGSNPGSGSAPIAGGIAPGGAVGTPPLVGDNGGTAAPPVLSPPGTDLAASSTGDGFSGVGVGWLLGALLGAGLIGWGLTWFLGLAGGALGLGCRLGAPTSVPDLRSVTA